MRGGYESEQKLIISLQAMVIRKFSPAVADDVSPCPRLAMHVPERVPGGVHHSHMICQIVLITKPFWYNLPTTHPRLTTTLHITIPNRGCDQTITPYGMENFLGRVSLTSLQSRDFPWIALTPKTFVKLGGSSLLMSEEPTPLLAPASQKRFGTRPEDEDFSFGIFLIL